MATATYETTTPLSPGGPARHAHALPGEPLSVGVAAEVAGWIGVYESLVAVVAACTARAPMARDRDELAETREWMQARLAYWRRSYRELLGIALDGRTGRITANGCTVALTRREAELLDFLLSHPNQRHTSGQIAEQAWGSPWLSSSQVRTYVMRLRRRLRSVGLDGLVDVRRQVGYSITGSART